MAEPSRPTPEQLRRYSEQFTKSQVLRSFGLALSFPDSDTVQVELDPVRPEHRGGLGTDAVNGGVLAAVFDLVIGCTPALVDPTRRTATVQLSMSFMRPVIGARLRAVGHVDRAGESILFSSAQILDEKGQVCAVCQGVVRMSKLRWASGESPAF